MGGNLVLKNGEAGVYRIPANISPTGKVEIMMKIGDGNGTTGTAFKDLPWLSANAADVYPWAKRERLNVVEDPNYTGNVVSMVEWDSGSEDDGVEPHLRIVKGVNALTSHQSIKTLDTTATTAQTTNASEAIAGSGKIILHKVSKTGSYNDLRDKPTIGNGALTIYQNGETKTTFYANQSGVGAADLTDTNYQLIKSGTKLELQSKTNGSFTTVSGQTFDLADMLKSTFVNTSGDTMTGPLYLPAEDPSEDYEATTKTYVDNLVASAVSAAVQFLGTFGSDATLAGFKFDSNGDFARCSDTYESQWYGTIHAGDIAVVTDKTKIASTGAYKIVHGETYTMNSATADGYVAKGQGNANKVWKTDASGNPGWRDDTNTAHSHGAGAGLTFEDSQRGGISGTVTYKAKLLSETKSTSDASDIGGSWLQPVSLDAQGYLSIKIPDSNFKFSNYINEINLSTIAGDTLEVYFPQAIQVENNGIAEITFKEIVGKEVLENEETISWDSADNTFIPTVPMVRTELGRHGGIDKVGTVTSVSAGVGLKITGTSTVNPKIEFDDSVIFVLNGGTATTVI